MKEKLYQYLLLLGDNPLILGHRLSELCGHGPTIETDIALTNIALDLFGQVRNYFQFAAKLKGEETSEDEIAFLRYVRAYRNALLVEQPNADFAHVVGRQFLFDAYHLPLLESLCHSNEETISAIAQKSIKEVRYHFRFSSSWLIRLGDGTEESHQRMQNAINHLWPYTDELLKETPIEQEMKELGIGADLEEIRPSFHRHVKVAIKEAGLQIPDQKYFQYGGKKGIHSEQLGYILSDLQYMQRAYPGMEW